MASFGTSKLSLSSPLSGGKMDSADRELEETWCKPKDENEKAIQALSLWHA